MIVLSIRRTVLALGLLLCSLIAQIGHGQDARIELNQAMVAATNDFMAGLTQFQRNKGVFDFDDDERLNWHFIPRDRNGVLLKSLDQEQLAKAHALLQTFFSAKGYAKTESIRGLESVLAEIEVGGRFTRDPDLYYISVFGEPGMDSDWALRYEGHHLAFNWTFVRGLGIASTPQFFGSNPAEVRSGNSIGLRVLGTEENIARDLVTSLDQQQLSEAVLNIDVPRDIVTGAQKEVAALDDSGVSFADLDSAQKQLLLSLIEEVATAQATAIADARMANIREQGLDAVKFTWIGTSELGAAHYFRVQGPGFLIEYDNTQNNANHVHLVWRDFSGDFGRDLLRQHYDSVALGNNPGHQH